MGYKCLQMGTFIDKLLLSVLHAFSLSMSHITAAFLVLALCATAWANPKEPTDTLPLEKSAEPLTEEYEGKEKGLGYGYDYGYPAYGHGYPAYGYGHLGYAGHHGYAYGAYHPYAYGYRGYGYAHPGYYGYGYHGYPYHSAPGKPAAEDSKQ